MGCRLDREEISTGGSWEIVGGGNVTMKFMTVSIMKMLTLLSLAYFVFPKSIQLVLHESRREL